MNEAPRRTDLKEGRKGGGVASFLALPIFKDRSDYARARAARQRLQGDNCGLGLL